MTSAASPMATGALPVIPMRRVIGAYLAEARYESIRMMRAPAFAVPFLLIPLAVYAFFAAINRGSTTAPANTPIYLLTGFSVMAVMGPALFGFGLTLALEREQGLLRLKRALPMPPMAYLLAKMVMAMLFAALATATLMVTSVLVNPTGLGPGQMLGIVAVDTIGTLPFCAIGLFIGARISGRAAPAVVNLVYLPLIYLSGLFFPLPQAIRAVALVSPAFHLNQLSLLIAGVGSILPPAMHAGALLFITVLFAGLTVRRLTAAA